MSSLGKYKIFIHKGFLINFIQAIYSKKDNTSPSLPLTASYFAEALEIVNHRECFSNFADDKLVKLTNELINSNVGSTYIRKLHNTGENFLTEAGLYKAIFQSRNPKAKDIQRWVFTMYYQ